MLAYNMTNSKKSQAD